MRAGILAQQSDSLVYFLQEIYPGSEVISPEGCLKAYDVVFVCPLPREATDLFVGLLEGQLSRLTASTKVVFFSSSDVLECSSPQSEDEYSVSDDPYGSACFQLEEFVRSTFAEHHVLRLPHVFGLGVDDSSVFYDLIFEHNVEQIHLGSRVQYYDLRWLQGDLSFVLSSGIQLYHCASEAVLTRELVVHFFSSLLSRLEAISIQHQGTAPLSQRMLSNYPVRSSNEVLTAMSDFLRVFRAIQNGFSKRLSVSSSHWDPRYDVLAVSLLKQFGISQIELVPSKYFNPDSWTESEVLALRHKFEVQGLRISCLGNVLLGITGSLSDSAVRERVVIRLRSMVELSALLGASSIVLGAPKLRAGCSALNVIDVLRGCLETLEEHKSVTLCLEPIFNSVSFEEVADIVSSLGSPFIRCAFDTGAALTTRDPAPESFELIGHLKVTMPFLRNTTEDDVDLKSIARKYAHVLVNADHCTMTVEANSSVSFLSSNIFRVIKELAPRVLIIGGGWYGCHASVLLTEWGIPHKVVDRLADVMQASSAKNQNRLHLGFHYPRSQKTRRECIEGFSRFLERYEQTTRELRNFYMISRRSIIDAGTYLSIFLHEKIGFTTEENFEAARPYVLNPNEVDGGLILCSERFIDPKLAYEYFSRRITARNEPSLKLQHFDTVLDCTYGQLLGLNHCVYEVCITFLYRMTVRTDVPVAVTVMDGPFYSLYPSDPEEGIFTLTHVSHTPVKLFHDSASDAYSFMAELEKDEGARSEIRGRMEADVKLLVKNFEELFEYHSFYLSMKTKFKDTGSDDRSMRVQRRDNIYSFCGGKITGIFHLEAELRKMLADSVFEDFRTIVAKPFVRGRANSVTSVGSGSVGR